jgi:hypothetical protein
MFRILKKDGSSARSAWVCLAAKPTSFNFLAHSYENESAHKDTMATSIASCLVCNLSNIWLHSNLKRIIHHKQEKGS